MHNKVSKVELMSSPKINIMYIIVFCVIFLYILTYTYICTHLGHCSPRIQIQGSAVAEHSATWFLYLLCQGRWFLSLVPQFCVINYNVKTLRKYWTMISASLHWVITKKCGTEWSGVVAEGNASLLRERSPIFNIIFSSSF